MSKLKAQRRHARRRLSERFELCLNDSQIQELSSKIKKQKPEAKFVDRQSNRVTRWFVRYRDKWLPVVYDSKRKTIVTVLPEDALGPPPASAP